MPIFSIRVIGSTELSSDCPMKNVTVRVSIVSLRNGQLAEKLNPISKCFSSSETTTSIPQVSTAPVHCHTLSSLMAVWAKPDNSDVFLYNEPVETLQSPNTAIIFEIIDYTIHPKRTYFNPIAWAFLKLPPEGSPANVFGRKSVLQLFSYPPRFDATVDRRGHLPVLELFAKRTPLHGRLTVELNIVDSAVLAKPNPRPRHFFEEEGRDGGSDFGEEEEEIDDDFVPTPRHARPECQIPRALAAQIPAGERGVLCLRFNNAGTVLAAALQVDSDFAIQFYDTERLMLQATVRAHINLIYELAFSHDDRHFLSVSSDGMCKVWASKTRVLQRSLPHSDYLYSGKFHPKNDRLVATAGFDGIVRIWDRTTGHCLAEGETHGARVNSVVFSPDGERLYSGDSRGVICVWQTSADTDAPVLRREREVRHREIEGVAITHLSMGRLSFALLVYTQDGVVRNIETEPMEVLQRFTGAKCTKFRMQAEFSPDAKFVVAGSETGSVNLWLVKNREPVQIPQWTGKFTKPVTAIAWNPVSDMVAFASFAPGENILVFDVGENAAVRLRARRDPAQFPLPP